MYRTSVMKHECIRINCEEKKIMQGSCGPALARVQCCLDIVCPVQSDDVVYYEVTRFLLSSFSFCISALSERANYDSASSATAACSYFSAARFWPFVICYKLFPFLSSHFFRVYLQLFMPRQRRIRTGVGGSEMITFFGCSIVGFFFVDQNEFVNEKAGQGRKRREKSEWHCMAYTEKNKRAF